MIGTLSKQQTDVLIGLMLGDGHLEHDGYRGTRLQVKQSEEKKEYVFWLYSQFAHMTKTPPQQRKDTGQWYFGTRFFEILENIRKMFYVDRKKVLPSNIADIFDSPLTLAVWFMDDGRLDYRAKSHYAYHISTDSFTESEVRRLQALLLERFGIVAKTYLSLCRGKRYPKLYIGKEGRDLFTKTVAPYMLPCFEYKVPPIHRVYFDPSETTRRAPLSKKAAIAYLRGALHDATFSSNCRFRFSQKGKEWLEIIQEMFTSLGHKSWIYQEGKTRDVFVLETLAQFLDFDLDPLSLQTKSERRAYVGGFFDAEGGIPHSALDHFYVQLVQNDKIKLQKIQKILNSFGIRLGKIHNPSRRLHPEYWRVFVRADSQQRFVQRIEIRHPRKRKLLRERMMI